MWPDISPAIGAFSSFILSLMSEWPVFHMTGSPAGLRIASGSACEHFTSKMIGLALARAREDVPRVEDEDVIAPDDVAGVVHDADAVRVAVERDADLRLFASSPPR